MVHEHPDISGLLMLASAAAIRLRESLQEQGVVVCATTTQTASRVAPPPLLSTFVFAVPIRSSSSFQR